MSFTSLDPGEVEIVCDAHGVLLVDTRDPQNGATRGAWPQWRFTYPEWHEFLDRANETRTRE